MRRQVINRVAVAMVIGLAAWVWGAEQNVGELTRELAGEKAAASRTPEELEAAYAKVIDALVGDLGGDDIGKRTNANRTIERLAFNASRPGAEAERAACSKAIAAKLAGDLPPVAASWMIRQLERIGRAEALPQLAKLLDSSDAMIRDCARRALQKNASAEAGEALRKAIPAASDPAWRAALVNALAARREAANLDVLKTEAASENDAVRIAAMRGLARLGDQSAANVLAAAMTKGSERSKQVAADSYLMLADALAASDIEYSCAMHPNIVRSDPGNCPICGMPLTKRKKGENAAALRIYKNLVSADGDVKCAAVIGVGRAGSVSDLQIIFDALTGADVRLTGSCVDAMALMKGADVAAAIIDKAKDAHPQIKPALLQALARRGDAAALPMFVAAAQDGDEAVRIQAIRGLGVVGDAASVPLLLKIAATSGSPQQAARDSLEHVRAVRGTEGDTINRAILAAITNPDASIRREVVRALAARALATGRALSATNTLLKSAEDADGGVRGESFKALGNLGGTDALPAVASLLVKTNDDGARNAAADSLARIAGRESDAQKRSEPILKALESANGPARLALIGVLGRIGGANSLEAARAAMKDNDAKVRDAAVRALADWPDAGSASDLLAIANSATEETSRVLALRGYVRVVRLENSRPAAETARMLADALQAAKRPDEKKQVLGALAEVRDIAALQAVAPCMDDATLAEEAAHAAMRIGRDIVNDRPAEVKSAMQKALAVVKNADVQRQAKETIDRADQRLNRKN